ncbi:metal-sensing transcriptional repressor [Paenibacillus sp. LHD-117]|nr:metal-sensing transcriptional repressor [Paenibacillus sp. LHD-117]MDQ6423088.1 metal-sensing transcriptional repressor [Paenibacillus sp. LHD-117]
MDQDMGCCSHEEGERKGHYSDRSNSSLADRLNRIEGQIRGIKSMIEKDIYYNDVLNQIASVQASLNSVEKLFLNCSLMEENLLAGDKSE